MEDQKGRTKTGKKPAIFFHVGLGKVASTYLQYRFFPKIRGIRYIQRTQYKKAKRIIEREGYDKYLISREFDRQMEEEVRAFAQDFPQTRPIIILRDHADWIASQYRRYVKNGFPGYFRDFMDIGSDRGSWKKAELDFSGKLRVLEDTFEASPIVLFYDDLIADPIAFFDRLAKRMGVSYEKDRIGRSRKHRSYNEKQLKAVRALNRVLPLRNRKAKGVPGVNWTSRLLKKGVRYSAMYIGGSLPRSCFSEEPLIPPQELEWIREACRADWKECVARSGGLSGSRDQKAEE